MRRMIGVISIVAIGLIGFVTPSRADNLNAFALDSILRSPAGPVDKAVAFARIAVAAKSYGDMVFAESALANAWRYYGKVIAPEGALNEVGEQMVYAQHCVTGRPDLALRHILEKAEEVMPHIDRNRLSWTLQLGTYALTASNVAERSFAGKFADLIERALISTAPVIEKPMLLGSLAEILNEIGEKELARLKLFRAIDLMRPDLEKGADPLAFDSVEDSIVAVLPGLLQQALAMGFDDEVDVLAGWILKNAVSAESKLKAGRLMEALVSVTNRADLTTAPRQISLECPTPP